MSTSLELQTKLGTQEVQENPQLRMKTMVALVTRYMVTYPDQYQYENYQDHTFINDVLYVLGVALNPGEHTYADGFDRFKIFLVGFLLKSLSPEQILEATESLLPATISDLSLPPEFTDFFKLSDEI